MEKKEKTFEESLLELEKLVSTLESGNIDLDKAIEYYTEAMKLVSSCSNKLKNATEKVNKILVDNKLENFEIKE